MPYYLKELNDAIRSDPAAFTAECDEAFAKKVDVIGFDVNQKKIELYREDIDDEVIFAAELIGVEVFCDGNAIGKITDVLDYPGNSVYVVKGEHEYMIPAVKSFILSTDMEKNEMQVKLIEGMRSDEN